MSKESQTTEKVNEVVSLTEEQRIQILVAQLNERYQAWHQMRDRSTQFTLWILGLAVAASWRFLQEPSGDMLQKAAATILVLLLGYAAFFFLKSLSAGLRTNREVLIKTETALGLHSSGAILHDTIILPPKYKALRRRPSAHFCTLYLLLLVTSIYLLSAIWIPSTLSPAQIRSTSGSVNTYQSKDQELSAPTARTSTAMPTTIKGEKK